MPNCFSLTRKSDVAAGPVPLITIDEEICKHFGVEPDPKWYYRSWFDTIGLTLAMGKSFEWIINESRFTPETIAIARFLDEHFTPDAWAERWKWTTDEGGEKK